jgi:hypothetical protein
MRSTAGKVVVEGCEFIANMKMPRDDSWSKEGPWGKGSQWTFDRVG